jgi:hypothetical protein
VLTRSHEIAQPSLRILFLKSGSLNDMLSRFWDRRRLLSSLAAILGRHRGGIMRFLWHGNLDCENRSPASDSAIAVPIETQP